MDTLIQDIRYSIRAMMKSPGFAAVAILSLALGIGANTSIFSVVNAVLLRSLPYKNPDHLAMLFIESEQPGKAAEISDLWSYPKFRVLRDTSQSFEQIAVVSDQNFPLTGTDSPERLNAEMVSASLGSSERSCCSTPSRRKDSSVTATLRREKLMPAARPMVATTTRNWPALASGSMTPARAP